MFRCAKHIIFRGTPNTYKLLKLLKHHVMTQCVAMLCELLMRWKLFHERSGAAGYINPVI